ncbi:4,5-dihydroxyphthalate decarboxylase [Silvibacterium sp.]|uniref:4,5-dihydroxyphthalate decarboxylase n=1 Tax=Silvibacterium sp. TaxID=1964179 RepID=UPI0039E35DF0
MSEPKRSDPRSHLPLDIAFWNYDRTQALADGRVKIPGVDTTFHSAKIVTEIFEGAVHGKYQVSELGLTYFLRTFQGSQSPFVAIPVFPNRAFRHAAIYVNKASGIRTPSDLNGKTIGELALYSHDAGIMAKGMLMDEHGFRPESCRWIVGGLDWPMKPIDFVAKPHPENVAVSDIAEGKELGAMLDSGEIDALISADNPKCILENSPNVTRLFPDYPDVERAYYQRTGIFPIMHTVVIRRDVLAQSPGLAQIIYKGFCEAKDEAVKQYEFGRIFNNMANMIPWLTHRIDTDKEILGSDWWPYGIEANRKALEAVLRYHYEQGITSRRFSLEEIFVPELLQT